MSSNIIALNRKEFELKFDPQKPTNGLIPLNHPEFMINGKTTFFDCDESMLDSDAGLVGIESSLLITNAGHTGIWLLKDENKGTISIPHNMVDRDSWNDSLVGIKDPYAIFLYAILKMFADKLGYDAIREPLWKLDNFYIGLEFEHLLRNFGFNLLVSIPQFFYQYYISSIQEHLVAKLRNIKVYYLIEVIEPNMTWLTDSTTPHYQNDFIWYSRKMHKSIRKLISKDRKEIFKDTMNYNDIRVTVDGIGILDNIFSTKSIFGKI